MSATLDGDIILVTGSTGFVGRQVLRILIKNGNRIRLVLRSESNLAELSSQAIEKIIYSDDIFTESSEWWLKACSGVATVIHLAWYAEPGKYINSEKNIDCLIGTLRLADGAIKAGVRRVVGIGTCFEYCLRDSRLLSINTPLEATNLYSAAKISAFQTLTHLFFKSGISFAWCRLFYLFGEGEDGRRLVPYIRRQLEQNLPAMLTRGDQIRDYLNVEEAGKLIVSVALNNNLIGAFNICSGVPVSVKEFALSIASKYKKEGLLKFGGRKDNPEDPPYILGIKNT